VVTDDVPEGATMIGLKARSTLVPAETWLREFIPYGTPCDEPCEPDVTRVEVLEKELAALRAEMQALRTQQQQLPLGDPLPPRKSGTDS